VTGDIHDLPPSGWGELSADLIGSVVEVRIVCVHAFGIGVELTANGSYGHVNSPRVTDGRYVVEEFSGTIGELRRALLLAVPRGRQPTLTLRPSDV
jgi:hypothetical protein